MDPSFRGVQETIEAGRRRACQVTRDFVHTGGRHNYLIHLIATSTGSGDGHAIAISKAAAVPLRPRARRKSRVCECPSCNNAPRGDR
jgi:hypothetical protein